MAEFIDPLKTLLAEWQTLTEQIGAIAMNNPDKLMPVWITQCTPLCSLCVYVR